MEIHIYYDDEFGYIIPKASWSEGVYERMLGLTESAQESIRCILGELEK